MKFLVSFLFILVSFASWVAEAAKVDVRVQELTTVRSGEAIRLGHIVSERSQTSLDPRFYDLVIYEALPADEERNITAVALAKVLREKLSFQDLQSLNLKTPEKITFRAKRNYLSSKDFAREIIQRAEDLCMGCEAEIDELNIPQIQGSGEILQVKLDTNSFRGAGSFLLPLHVVTSKGNVSYWLTGKVSLFKEASVATRLIQANERITENDIQQKRVNINFMRDGLPNPKDIVGKKAGRTLSVGQAIYSNDLKKEPAVQRGQIVKIILGDESFEVTSTGTAEEGGSVGDLIKVKNSENQKMLSGVLIEPGIVKVN